MTLLHFTEYPIKPDHRKLNHKGKLKKNPGGYSRGGLM
jgi:hypothetical protein